METSWTIRETDERLTIIHDNRWLAIVGVPMMLVGLVIAVGPWLIEEARTSGAWPILAVGSLLGLGFVVFGLALCFKYEEIEADRSSGLVFRRAGLPPFRRTRSWSWADLTEVAAVTESQVRTHHPGSSLHYRLRLIGPKCSLLVASSFDREPIEAEAPRWARFLDKPLRKAMQEDPQERLRESLRSKRPASS